MILPPRLKVGDRATIVSPSGSIADYRDLAERSKDALEKCSGLVMQFSEHAFGKEFYSSGTAEERRADLMNAFIDPDVKAIVLSLGGATAIDVVEVLDYEVIADNPKIIAGISDCATILNAITARTGLVTFHGLELFDFGRHGMPFTADSIREVWFDGWHGKYGANPDWADLEGDTTRFQGWREIKPGVASGVAVGGNSEALTQLIDTPYSPPLVGSILALETYRLQKRHIHALLTSLRMHGVFDRIAGLVIGYCLGSDEPGGGNERDIADIARETTSSYSFPIMQVGEIGHQVQNFLIPIGAEVRMDSSNLTLELTKPAVL